MSENLTLTIIIKSEVDQATAGLKKIKSVTENTAKEMSVLQKAGAQAAGMLLRDMVQGATAAFGEIVKLGGQVKTLQSSFNKLTKDAGATDLSLKSLRSATQNMVSDVDLLTSANQALLLGLPTEGMEELFGAAIKLGQAMGIDASFAVDSLTKGIGRQSKMILDNLGVLVDAGQANEWYADKIGVSSDALTDSQRKLAWQEFAMEQVKIKADSLGDVISDTALAQEQYNAKIENAKTAVGGFLAPLGALLPIFQSLMPMLGTMGGVLLPKLITKQALATAGTKVMAVAQGLLSGQITLTSIAQGILNAIMSVNPIFLVIAAIGALVVALIWLYNNFKPVRDVIDTVIGALKSLWDFISGVGKAIGDFFGGLVNTSKNSSNEMADEFEGGLNKMRGDSEDFYDDMYGRSLWPDLMKGLVNETEKGLGKVKGEFADLETITPQVAHTFSPATSSGMTSGGGGGPIEIHVLEGATFNQKMGEGEIEYLIQRINQGIVDDERIRSLVS